MDQAGEVLNLIALAAQEQSESDNWHEHLWVILLGKRCDGFSRGFSRTAVKLIWISRYIFDVRSDHQGCAPHRRRSHAEA